MPEYAVYVTDQSDFPDQDVFYVFETDNIEEALEAASSALDQIRKGWGAMLHLEFALPADAARLAVSTGGAVELRDSNELVSYAARLHR